MSEKSKPEDKKSTALSTFDDPIPKSEIFTRKIDVKIDDKNNGTFSKTLRILENFGSI